MKDSTSENNAGLEANSDLRLIAGMPSACLGCGRPLCLRKQVINLALGNDEEMFCLDCLGNQNEKSGEGVLVGIKDYIKGRDCFRKEWIKYEGIADCPDPSGCYPHSCFD